MKLNKTLETRYLNLQINITHIGRHNHEIINASIKTIRDFDNILDDTISYLNGRIKSWEAEHKEVIKQVGR